MNVNCSIKSPKPAVDSSWVIKKSFILSQWDLQTICYHRLVYFFPDKYNYHVHSAVWQILQSIFYLQGCLLGSEDVVVKKIP